MFKVLLPRQRIAFVLVCAVLSSYFVWELFKPRAQWLGWYPAVSGVLLGTTLLPMCFAATFAAWAGGYLKNQPLPDLIKLSPHQPYAPARELFAAITLTFTAITWMIFIPIQIYVWLTSVHTQNLLLPCLMALLNVLVSYAAMTALGLALARYLRAVPAICIAPCLPYTLIALTSAYGGVQSLGLAFTFWDSLPWLYLRTSTATLTLRLLFWLAVTCMLLAFVFQASGLLRRCALALLVVITVLTGSYGINSTAIRGADNAVCKSNAMLTVCSPAYGSQGLDAYLTHGSSLISALPTNLRPRTLLGTVTDLEANLASAPQKAIYAPSSFGESTDTALVDRNALAATLARNYLLANCTDKSAGKDLNLGLSLWWLKRSGVSETSLPDYAQLRPYATSEVLGAEKYLSSVPYASLENTLNRKAQKILACEATLDDIKK